MKKKEPGQYVGMGIALGAGIGSALGIAVFDNVAIGVALGTGIGVAIGTSLEEAAKRRGEIRELTEEEGRKKKKFVWFALGFALVLAVVVISTLLLV